MSSLSDQAELASNEQADWWKNSSTAELKEIVSAGVSGGIRFDFAVREIERRSRESSSLAEANDAERKQREANRNRAVQLAIAGGAAALVLLMAMIFWT